MKNDVQKSAASVFRAIDNRLKLPGGGCSDSIAYMEQSSWLLFLRYLDDRETDRKNEAMILGRPYTPALPKELAWSTWAYPVDKDGNFDRDKALVGDDLIKFVKETLFPRLKKMRDEARDVTSIQYRIGSIFTDLTCRMTNGYIMREVIDLIQPLKFETEEARHEMSVLYEERLRNMGNAGRDGGQYYTPRSLIRVMIRILDPKVGEKFDDGASGSCGFLCEGYEYMKGNAKDPTHDYEILQRETFSGGEASPIAYVTGQMNCILHGLESPNVRFGKGSTVSSQLTGSVPKALPQKGSTVSSLSVEQGLLLYSGDDVDIAPSALFNRLSFSHICEMLHLPEPMMRTFYAFEAIRGSWSVRALRRQIDSQYYQRVGWAKNPHKLAALAQGRAEKLDAKDFIKQNTVLEFLGLKPQGDWDESDLEKGIIDNLKALLRELGTGFCFEDQQQNVLIDDVYERIDLVFYHRILKCHVLIELKSKKLNYKDVAQLGLYVSYYRKNKMTAGDNPPIGILLCTSVGQETAEYLAPFTDPQLFLSQYQLQLPAKEQFTDFLKKTNEGLPRPEKAKGRKRK